VGRDVFGADYFRTQYRDYVAQNPPRRLHFYADTVERHTLPGVPRRIHDIGCAFGHFLGSLDTRWEIFGTDVSEWAVAQAARDYSRGVFRVAAAVDGPVFGAAFGAVTAFDVVEHVPDPDAVARSAKAQLVEGGCFVCVVPVYDGLSGPIIRRLDRDPTHLHRWPRQRWLDWASGHFALVEWTGILRYLLPLKYYLHVATRTFRYHTPAIILVGRKR
jgi:SAM-dependent methyltransferase